MLQWEQIATAEIRAIFTNHNSGQQRENRMKSRKLLGVVFGSLAMLALSLPAMGQEPSQTTTTTTQAPSTPQTQSTQTTESTTKYKHHHKKVEKEKQTTTTSTTPSQIGRASCR